MTSHDDEHTRQARELLEALTGEGPLAAPRAFDAIRVALRTAANTPPRFPIGTLIATLHGRYETEIDSAADHDVGTKRWAAHSAKAEALLSVIDLIESMESPHD